MHWMLTAVSENLFLLSHIYIDIVCYTRLKKASRASAWLKPSKDEFHLPKLIGRSQQTQKIYVCYHIYIDIVCYTRLNKASRASAYNEAVRGLTLRNHLIVPIIVTLTRLILIIPLRVLLMICFINIY